MVVLGICKHGRQGAKYRLCCNGVVLVGCRVSCDVRGVRSTLVRDTLIGQSLFRFLPPLTFSVFIFANIAHVLGGRRVRIMIARNPLTSILGRIPLPIKPLSCGLRMVSSAAKTNEDIEAMLATPCWSVASLLGSPEAGRETPKVTQKQLHHLSRLTALPIPTSAEREAKLISDLQSQLRFVQAIQEVDTEGVEPLQRSEAMKENEIGLETLRHEFERERVVGKRGRIVKEKAQQEDGLEMNYWDPVAQASRKIGRFIVVDTAND